MEIAGIKDTPRGPAVGDLADVDWEVQQFFERAAQVATRTGFAPRPGVSRTEALWQAARTNRLGAEPVTKNAERAAWGRSLPEFGAARLRRRYLPALAQCALAASTSSVQRYDHIVVDEAQDVRPLEWAILRRLNPAEGWTIVGDVNQRRTEHSHSSWAMLLHDLAIDDVKPLVLERGYRSTRPIMQFANRLLPKDQRSLNSLRETGPDPRVVPAKVSELSTAILAQAAALTGRYPRGSTAIIMVELARMIGALRERGWQGSSTSEWTNGTARIFLLTPDEARGVEFDGVIVVEPAAFPDTFGRRGPLYTSLTRANQELVVVHSQPLPEALRR